ncbi:MAG: hypothetical protein EBR82_07245 [Caulobacteraceae bacterium]|nr:hypothetical protein [Caulobacteraceae bacterium]
MSITIPSQPLLAQRSPYSLDIRAAVAGLNGKGGDMTIIASALNQIQSSTNRLEKAMRDSASNTFGEIIIRDASGKLIGWIGSRAPYFGGWVQQLYVGADGPDTAPFFADVNGDVIIGKNGSLSIQDGGANEVGWLGVQADSPKTITGATNATPIVVTSNAHGYEDGDTVFIAAVGGNTATNGYRIVQGATPNTFELTDLSGIDVAGSGAYTTGGTATRYFGGGRFQTIAVGDSFTNYKLRAYADGQLKIKNALITLTDVVNNGYIELNPSTGPDAIFRDTFTTNQIRLFQGTMFANNAALTGEYVQVARSGISVYNSTPVLAINLTSSGTGGSVTVRNSTATATITLTGSSGTITATNVNVTNEYRVGGTAVVTSARAINATAYSVSGTPGIDNTASIPTSFSYTTANAITSVNFGGLSTTSASFIQTLTYTNVTITHSKGVLTSAV